MAVFQEDTLERSPSDPGRLQGRHPHLLRRFHAGREELASLLTDNFHLTGAEPTQIPAA
jgi:hypothetical protein